MKYIPGYSFTIGGNLNNVKSLSQKQSTIQKIQRLCNKHEYFKFNEKYLILNIKYSKEQIEYTFKISGIPSAPLFVCTYNNILEAELEIQKLIGEI